MERIQTHHYRLRGLVLLLPLLILMVVECVEASQESFVMFDVTVVAPSCIINDNTQIVVDFGDDIDITRLGEAGYKLAPIDFTLACNTPRGYSLTVQGTGAAFNDGVLATDKQHLGIEITHKGVRFPLNTRLSFTYPNIPALQAQPVVSRTGSPSVGEFSATATMRVNYD